MTTPRIFDDGTLAYPHRGDPPPDRIGYIRDPGQPYHLLPVAKPCAHRTSTFQPCNCPSGGGIRFSTCSLGIPLKAGTCNACTQRKTPDPMEALWSEFEAGFDSAESLTAFIDRIDCPSCREKFVGLLESTPPAESWTDFAVQIHRAMLIYFDSIPSA